MRTETTRICKDFRTGARRALLAALMLGGPFAWSMSDENSRLLDQAQRSAQEELTRLQSTAHDQMVARLKDESAGRNASDEPSDRNFNSDLTSALYSLNGDSNDNANGDADTAALSSRAAAPVPTLSTSSSPALSPVLSTSASDDGASRL